MRVDAKSSFFADVAHVPVILKDTATSALVCPLSKINKDL